MGVHKSNRMSMDIIIESKAIVAIFQWVSAQYYCLLIVSTYVLLLYYSAHLFRERTVDPY